MIQNIFLDAGGVILDETEFENDSAKIITGLINQYNNKYVIENYWKDIEEAVYRFVPKVYDYVLYKNIGEIVKFQTAKTEYKIDKDVIPAKLVGMKTVRIKTGIHRNQEPRTPEEIADITVEKLCEIKIEKLKELK